MREQFRKRFARQTLGEQPQAPARGEQESDNRRWSEAETVQVSDIVARANEAKCGGGRRLIRKAPGGDNY